MDFAHQFTDWFLNNMLHDLQIWLVHPQQEMCAAFAERFSVFPNVRIFQGTYEELEPHDCFVTAGNAYGIMTAGIDAVVIQRFGVCLMERIQLRIQDEYLGEQPIGTAFVEPTGNSEFPFIVHAPTMRVPGSIEGTDKVYTATWAALLAVHNHNIKSNCKINVVAFPAMGTGFGGVPFTEAARQMAVAYDHFLHPPIRFNWEFVAARHKAIAYDGNKQVVK